MIVPAWEIPEDYASVVATHIAEPTPKPRRLAISMAPLTSSWWPDPMMKSVGEFGVVVDKEIQRAGPQPAPQTKCLHEHTTSVNRSYSDLDPLRFALAAGGLCALRTAVQHPMTLALTRKQTCPVAADMNTSEILRRICKMEGGLGALRQGMAVTVLGCAATEMVYLVALEYLREALPFQQEASRDAAAGYAADITSRTLYNPISIVSLRQMTQFQFSHGSSSAAATTTSTAGAPASRASALHVLRSLFREGGARSLLCGLGMTLAIGSQYSAIWWTCYLQSKRLCYEYASPFLRPHDPSKWSNIYQSRDDNLMINSMASIATSAVAGVMFNPFFVTRANMQCSVRGTLRGTASALYRRGGARAFFQGTYLNVTACVIDGFLASTSYEYAKMFADRTHTYTPSSTSPW